MSISVDAVKLRMVMNDLNTAKKSIGMPTSVTAIAKALAGAEGLLTSVAGLSGEDPTHSQMFREYLTANCDALQKHVQKLFDPANIEIRLKALKDQPKEYWVDTHEKAKEAAMRDPDENSRNELLKGLDDDLKNTLAAYEDGSLFMQVLYMQLYEELMRLFMRPMQDLAIAAYFKR